MKRFLWLVLFCIAVGIPARAQDKESCGTKSGLCWPYLRHEAKANVKRNQVIVLQSLLQARGFSVAPDGRFGAATERAVRAFQTRKHLKVDGAVGWQTWEDLVPNLKMGARGPAVSTLQKLLVAGHYGVVRDGKFGTQTRRAVKKLQEDIALVEDKDGSASGPEWCYLMGGHFDGE